MRRPSTVTIVVFPVLLAIVANLATNTVSMRAPWWPYVVWTGLAALVAFELRRNRDRRPDGDAIHLRLDDAAQQLAEQVHAKWQSEEERRGVYAPRAIRVRWERATAIPTDHWANIRLTDRRADPGPLKLSGDMTGVCRVYRRIRSGRLVLLGRAGAGKTVLAVRFAMDMLDSRSEADPVAVVFRLGSWDPRAVPLRDWLAAQLIRDLPELAAPYGGATVAAALVDGNRILPVLDGFDEIRDGLRGDALRQLNAHPTLPLLVTSRTDEYRAMATDSGPLTGAAVVELRDLTPADLARYLPLTTHGPVAASWRDVVTRLHAHDDGPGAVLRQVLTTPLMVHLARTVCTDDGDNSPGQLLDLSRFPTVAALEAHLLEAYLPAVYHQFGVDRAWKAHRVHRYLTFLARGMDHRGTHDLAWWRLRDTVRPVTRVVLLTVICVATVGLGLGVLTGVVDGADVGLPVALTIGSLLGLVGGLPRTGPLPRRPSLRPNGSTRWELATILTAGGIGLAMGLLLGVADGPLDTLVWGLVGTGLGATLGAAAALISVSTQFHRPLDIARAVNMTSSLTADRTAAFAQTVWSGLALWLATGVVFGLTAALDHGSAGVPIGAVLGLVVAVILGPLLGLGPGAWVQWLIFVRFWLPLTGRLPWRVCGFLDDAHIRGVLRQDGAVYQFRHARLQDHLAASAGRTTAVARSEAVRRHELSS